MFAVYPITLHEGNLEIEVDAGKIADEMRQVAQESITEEDLRVRVENILRRVCEPLGIPWARYERTTVVRGLRSDALYGNVILEYEKPDAFKTKSGFDKAVEQLLLKRLSGRMFLSIGFLVWRWMVSRLVLFVIA